MAATACSKRGFPERTRLARLYGELCRLSCSLAVPTTVGLCRFIRHLDDRFWYVAGPHSTIP